jgi:hypothetical protein
MATLTADRHLAQRSLLDPHEEEQPLRTPHPQAGHDHRHAPAVRPPASDPEAGRVGPSAGRAGRTLDDLVAGTWDALLHTHSAACLLCGADLLPRWSSGPHPVAARCPDCGTELC